MVILIISILVGNIFSDGLPGAFILREEFQGSRQAGMGGIGYSMPDDENLLLLNPAGLGIANNRFNNVAFGYGNMFLYSYEDLKNSNDNLHFLQDHYLPICFQPSNKNIGGFGIHLESYSFIDREGIPTTEWDPITQKIVHTNDTIFNNEYLNYGIFGYGRKIFNNNQAIGVSFQFKHIYENNYNNPISNFLVYSDIGYTGSFLNGIHLGFSMRNIPLFKSTKGFDFPTLFDITPAFGFYKDIVKVEGRNALSLFTELNYALFFKGIKNNKFKIRDPFNEKPSKKTSPIHKQILSAGLEIGIFELLFLRNGYRLHFDDDSFKLIEFSNGIGLDDINHVTINFFCNIINYNPNYYQFERGRDIRIGCSLSFYNLSIRN